MKIEVDEDKLFTELYNLITRLHGIAKDYPTLYQLYLRVATSEKIQRMKKEEY